MTTVVEHADGYSTSDRMEHVKASVVVHDFEKVLAEIEAEGTDRAIPFVFKGRKFTIPSPLDWGDDVIEAQAAAQEGNPRAAQLMPAALLGEAEYAEFLKLGGTPIRFMRFFEKVFENPGESRAS